MGTEPASRERVRLAGVRQNARRPNDGVLPGFVGQLCEDYTNGGLYRAIGTGKAEWRPIYVLTTVSGSNQPPAGTWRSGDIVWRSDVVAGTPFGGTPPCQRHA